MGENSMQKHDRKQNGAKNNCVPGGFGYSTMATRPGTATEEDAEDKTDGHHTSEVQFRNTHAKRETHIECKGGGRVSHSLSSKKKTKQTKNNNLRYLSGASANLRRICTGSFILNAFNTVIQLTVTGVQSRKQLMTCQF